jgi:hypothetical protein
MISTERRELLLKQTLQWRSEWLHAGLQPAVTSIQKEEALRILKTLDEARRAKDCTPPITTFQPESPLEAEATLTTRELTNADLSAIKRLHLPFLKAKEMLERLEACESYLNSSDNTEYHLSRDYIKLGSPVSERVKIIIRQGFADLIAQNDKPSNIKEIDQTPNVIETDQTPNVIETDPITEPKETEIKADKNSEISTSSDLFLSRLLDPRAATIVELLRSFVRSFLELDIVKLYSSIPDPDALDDSDDDEAKVNLDSSSREIQQNNRRSAKILLPSSSGPGPDERVRAFLTRVEETMRKHPLWRDDTQQQWETTIEELERFVMGKVYKAVFAAHPACSRRDAHLSARLQSLSFVRLKQLDIDEPGPFLAPGWKLAQTAMREMDNVLAPADKLACIMNSCRIIAMLLSEAAEERVKGGGGRGVGADEFLPALIYTVIKAEPRRLYSNLRFIGEFRSPTKLMSESGYFYTNVLSAVAFAKNVKPDHLAMSKTEFDACTRAARKRAEYRRTREVRRAVGSTAAARRSGEFKGISGPTSVAQGDFVDELAAETRLLAFNNDGFSDDDIEDEEDVEEVDENVNIAVVDASTQLHTQLVEANVPVPVQVQVAENLQTQNSSTVKQLTFEQSNDALLYELSRLESIISTHIDVNGVHSGSSIISSIHNLLMKVYVELESSPEL